MRKILAKATAVMDLLSTSAEQGHPGAWEKQAGFSETPITYTM
jgi:hypothetical protein